VGGDEMSFTLKKLFAAEMTHLRVRVRLAKMTYHKIINPGLPSDFFSNGFPVNNFGSSKVVLRVIF